MNSCEKAKRRFSTIFLCVCFVVSALLLPGCRGCARPAPKNLPKEPREIELGILRDIPSVTDWNKKAYEALAVSPDEKWIAVAGFDETIKLFSTAGEHKWTYKIPESYGRSIAISSDSKTVYAGECSMDGNVYAIDIDSGKKKWSYSVGDDVGRPDNVDTTRWTHQACVYSLTASKISVFVLGTHSNRIMLDLPDGTQVVHYPTETLIYAFQPETGKVQWRYPAKGTMDTRMPMPLYSDALDHLVAANTSWRRNGAPEEKYPNGTVRLIHARTGKQSDEHRIEPSIMDYTSLWYGLSVSPNGKYVAAATNDGRISLFAVDKGPELRLLWERNITTLMTVSGIPIYAGGKYSTVFDDGSVFVVSGNTYAKRTVADESQEPPTEHPDGNSAFLFDLKGDIRWKWKAPGAIDGLAAAPGSKMMAVLVNHNYLENSLEASGFYFLKYLPDRDEPVARMGDFQIKGISVTGEFSRGGSLFAGIEVPIKLEDDTVVGAHKLHVIPVEFIAGE